MLSPSGVGLPYGNLPRLLVAWLTTEAGSMDSVRVTKMRRPRYEEDRSYAVAWGDR